MKKMYFYIASGALMIGAAAKAQVSTYLFFQSQETYQAINGGTVFGTTTSDDQVFVDPAVPAGVAGGGSGPGIPIGFTFTYNAIPFDVFGINNNGWISLGQSSVTPAVNTNASSNYTGISATSTAPPNLQNRIAGLARDLQAQAGCDLRVETIGIAPSRTCVIQWSNYRKYGQTGDAFDFQIRLCETTNIVEVMYGTFVNNATTGNAQVGLRGSTNADFNNRIVNTANPWASSIPGNANTSSADFNNSGLTPVSGQWYRWIPPSPCQGTPAQNSAVGNFTMVCPGGSNMMSLANQYTNTGMTYQWYESTISSFGPFVPITSATNAVLSVNSITANVWYSAVVGCTNSINSMTSSPFGVQIAGTTTNSVPYFEGFEEIIADNQLPNCSWVASNLPTICQTNTTVNTFNRVPYSGSKFASFKSGTPAGGAYFYTNGIQMEPGITYSASIKYITDGNLGWNELAILYGTSQSTTGLTPIASVSPAGGMFYQTLGNTFTVNASGLYYIAIKCEANLTPQYLSFDEVIVIAPCSLNSPSLNVSASASTVCQGDPVTFSAAGADSYLWNTGDVGPLVNITVSPNAAFTTFYTVTGTNTLTGCTAQETITLTVNPSPLVYIFPSSPYVCSGSSATLTALGAMNYVWSNSTQGANIVVTPGSATTYSVIGTNIYGCNGVASQMIGVLPLPNIGVNSSRPDEICQGETVTLIGTGGINYTWASNSGMIAGTEANVSPNVTTIYTVTGVGANGCANKVSYVQNVAECTGIREIGANASLNLYPNPGTGLYTLTFSQGGDRNIRVSDLSGKVVSNVTTSEMNVEIDIRQLPKGLYFVEVQSVNGTQAIKVIKE